LFFREICVTDPNTEAPEKAPETAAEPAPQPSEVELRLAAAEAEVARLNDEFLRAKAEAENARRRAIEDVARAHRFGIESFASSLLAVRDSLEAALAVEAPTIESLREGVGITHRQLTAAFEKASLAEISPLGEKFDPHRHQALSQVESDQAPNTVVTVFQKGYLLHDRVIRPALVVVAREKAAPAAESPPSA
jgi:molecular chaperone GrpE